MSSQISPVDRAREGARRGMTSAQEGVRRLQEHYQSNKIKYVIGFVILIAIGLIIYFLVKSTKSDTDDDDDSTKGTPGDPCTPESPDPGSNYVYNSVGTCGDLKSCDTSNNYHMTSDSADCVKDGDDCVPDSDSNTDPLGQYTYSNGKCVTLKGCSSPAKKNSDGTGCNSPNESCDPNKEGVTGIVVNGVYKWDSNNKCNWTKNCVSGYILTPDNKSCEKVISRCSTDNLPANRDPHGVYSVQKSTNKCVLSGCKIGYVLDQPNNRCVQINSNCAASTGGGSGENTVSKWIEDPVGSGIATCLDSCKQYYSKNSQGLCSNISVEVQRSRGKGVNIGKISTYDKDGNAITDDKNLPIDSKATVDLPEDGILRLWCEGGSKSHYRAYAKAKNINFVEDGKPVAYVWCDFGEAEFHGNSVPDSKWHHSYSTTVNDN
jgi:hypothetical protein